MNTGNGSGDRDGFGLDKAARLGAGRETEGEVEPLESPFPWNAGPFDPGFFGLGSLYESPSADAAT